MVWMVLFLFGIVGLSLAVMAIAWLGTPGDAARVTSPLALRGRRISHYLNGDRTLRLDRLRRLTSKLRPRSEV